ncbi:MAG: 4Fe-4S dicluster domain-containing protein [Candidatus Omnitrophota bacterium]
MRYPKIRELVEAIKALIKGPYTSKFPYKKHIPEKRYRGRPIYYKDDCVGCGACSVVCTSGCLKQEDILTGEEPKRRLTINYESCIFCGQCEANCITKKGIKLSNQLDDIATFNRKDVIEEVVKELILCEACSTLVGAKDHLLWVAKKLGPLAYSSPTSYLSQLKDLKLAYSSIEKSVELTRQDRIKILCHKCRREITLNT